MASRPWTVPFWPRCGRAASTAGSAARPSLAANKRTIYKIGAGYQITPQINLGAHYFRAEQKGNTDLAKAKADFFTMALDYAFSKRTDAYIEVDHTKLKGDQVSLNNAAGQPNGARSRTGYTIGLRHRF